MKNNQFTFDTVNLKKALMPSLILAAVLGVLAAVVDFLGGIWGILLLLAWAYVGVLYVNAVLATGERPQILSIGINGAILAAVAGLVYDVISSVVLGIRFQDSASYPLVSLYFIEAGIIGGLAAFAWYAYKTNAKS